MKSVGNGAVGHVRFGCDAGVLINPHISVYYIWKLALASASGVVGGAELQERTRGRRVKVVGGGEGAPRGRVEAHQEGQVTNPQHRHSRTRTVAPLLCEKLGLFFHERACPSTLVVFTLGRRVLNANAPNGVSL